MKHVKKLALLMALSLSLTACQTMATDGIDVKAACKAFQPITWSRKDTRLTQEQIVEYNKVRKAVCK